MTRVTVAYENYTYSDGRRIAPGAIEMTGDRVPVCFLGDHSKPIGFASSIEREDVGDRHVVTMDVHLIRRYRDVIDLEDESLTDASIYAQPVEFDGEPQKMQVIKAHLKAINIALIPGFSRAAAARIVEESNDSPAAD